MSIESVMPSNHLVLCRPLLVPSSIFPCIRVFSNESVLHIRWPKYGSFSFSIIFSNEYLGLISFRIDWFDLLAVQWTLKNLLQHHNSKTSILQCSAFFIVQYICNAVFQRIARRDKKAFLSDQCKEIEEKNQMGKTRHRFKKLEVPREYFMQRWA